MPEKQPNNPAGRLFAVLQAVKASRPKLDSKETAFNGWAAVFGVDPTDHTEVFRKLTILQMLPPQIWEHLRRDSNFDSNFHFAWMSKLVPIVRPRNLDAHWIDTVNAIDQSILVAVGFADQMISPRCATIDTDEDRMRAFLVEIRALIEEVRAHEGLIDEHVSAYLLDHLRLIERALLDYSLQGPEPVKMAVESAIGGVIIDPVVSRDVKSSPFGKRYWEVVLEACLFAGAASVADRLIGPSQNPMLTLPPVVERYFEERISEASEAAVESRATVIAGAGMRDDADADTASFTK